MGDLQTYFYLALISVTMISLTLLFVFVVFRSLRHWAKEAHGRTPLIFWLIGSAVTVALLFIVIGAAGVLYGFLHYGTQ